MRTQKYTFPWTYLQTPLPVSSLDPSDLRCQTASGSDPPFFFQNALDRSTYQTTDRRQKTLKDAKSAKNYDEKKRELKRNKCFIVCSEQN